MSEKVFRVLDLLKIDTDEKSLGLQCVAGKNGLDNIIESKNINRPGLALGGYFDCFAHTRVQVFGVGEATFVKNSKYEDEIKSIKQIMKYKIPCIFFSNNNMPPDFFLGLANERKIPILISEKSSDYLVSRLFQILTDVFANRKRFHGVLVEVFGIGILLKGQSGIGKSEVALELIERGHRLVADDSIDLKVIQGRTILGEGTSIIGHHMEIQGIGIIDVKRLFGVGAIRDKKNIQLVIELDKYDSDKEYDRIGLEEKYIDIMDVEIPYLLIPVMPGRNIPIIIETAAMNQRLKMMGINAAREFNKNLIRHLETEEIKKNFI
ncbi:MAG: HPr kinase/phosphorylase [Spirochaetes bacterium]|nr:HPr kinase/phosphorylase [Spirochaetota bacterium]